MAEDWMVAFCAIKRALDRAHDANNKGNWEQVAISCAEAKAVAEAERQKRCREPEQLAQSRQAKEIEAALEVPE